MKNRIPRKKKKAIKGAIFIYDVCGLPKWNSIQQVVEIFRKERVILFASKAGENMSGKDLDTRPQVINCRLGYQIKDLSK